MRPGQIVAVLIVIVIAVGLALFVLSNLPDGQPSPTAVPSSVASASPSPTSEPTFAIGCESAHQSGTLTLRLESIGELGRTWVISIYDDGRVLTPSTTPPEITDEAWMIVRFLTDAGVERLVGEVLDTGLFEASASYNPVLLPGAEHPGRGGSVYGITVARESGQIEVGWTPVFADDATYYEPSPERETLDALAANVVAFGSWLPAEEWASAEECTYEAQRFRIFVEAQAWGGSLEDLPVDIADIDWPLGGEMLDWGEEIDMSSADPAYVLRCGEVSRDVAVTLADGLRAAGAEPYRDAGLDTAAYVELRLGDREGTRVVLVYLEPLLPDESGCAGRPYPAYGRV